MVEARILIAGTSPALTSEIVGALMDQGHLVTTVKNVNAVSDELERTRYDALILDSVSLDGDEVELQNLMVQHASTIGIIILPEGAGDEDVINRLRGGWTEVLVQPLSKEGIITRLTQALTRTLRIREDIRRGTLTPLTNISEEFLLTLDLDAMLDCIVQTAQQEARCDRVSLMLVERKKLRIRAGVGLPGDLIANWEGEVGVGIAGYTAATGETVIIHQGEEDPRFRDHLKNDRIKSAVSLPLKVKKNIIGVLNVTNFAGREKFYDSDVQFLSLLASQAAVAIQNANLYNSLQISYLHTIVSLANALEARDRYLSGHSNHVMNVAVKIAHKMGLTEKEIEDIRNASTLHDIGKIGICDAILLKPGKLDESEWLVVQEHPEMGSRIIAPVRHLARCMPLILHHHEHWDGTGYPDGLAGAAIPLGARIIAVADTYDAMTSNRSYREAFDHKEAAAEIERVSGTQLDPEVVRVFKIVMAEEGKDAPET